MGDHVKVNLSLFFFITGAIAYLTSDMLLQHNRGGWRDELEDEYALPIVQRSLSPSEKSALARNSEETLKISSAAPVFAPNGLGSGEKKVAQEPNSRPSRLPQ